MHLSRLAKLEVAHGRKKLEVARTKERPWPRNRFRREALASQPIPTSFLCLTFQSHRMNESRELSTHLKQLHRQSLLELDWTKLDVLDGERAC